MVLPPLLVVTVFELFIDCTIKVSCAYGPQCYFQGKWVTPCCVVLGASTGTRLLELPIKPLQFERVWVGGGRCG